MRYPIVIHKEKGSDYGVIVPDLPGCFSAGDTIDDAITQAKEAIECHIEGLIADDEAIPEPQTIELHQTNEEYAGGVWAMVAIDLAHLNDKAKRINITVPERLLAMIDARAAQSGETRSGFLVRGALERLSH
jgi:predicted RNase H-like HicB family nuclease